MLQNPFQLDHLNSVNAIATLKNNNVTQIHCHLMEIVTSNGGENH